MDGVKVALDGSWLAVEAGDNASKRGSRTSHMLHSICEVIDICCGAYVRLSTYAVEHM